MNARPGLDQLGLSTDKKARLHRILHEHGLRNGTALFLPYDQGLEHGPRDFFANPAASDPKYILGLALGASARAQTASSGTSRSAASANAKATAGCEAPDPSAPATTGRGM
jgi:DhnA family fructose-bisphosphate aldolase class Ia